MPLAINTLRILFVSMPASSATVLARLLLPLHIALMNSDLESFSGVYFHIPMASSMISASLVISAAVYKSSLSTMNIRYFSPEIITGPQYVRTPFTPTIV